MTNLWSDLKAFWRVLHLRGTPREAWRMITTSLTRPGSFEGADGVEVGAQVFPPGSKYMSAGWCIPCSENCGRLTEVAMTGSDTPIKLWQFNMGMEK